jgi:hypothetical protein
MPCQVTALQQRFMPGFAAVAHNVDKYADRSRQPPGWAVVQNPMSDRRAKNLPNA